MDTWQIIIPRVKYNLFGSYQFKIRLFPLFTHLHYLNVKSRAT